MRSPAALIVLRVAHILSTMALGACGADAARSTVTEPIAVSEAQTLAAQTRWQGAGVTTYRLRTTVSCFCAAATLGELETTVINGVSERVTRVATGDTVRLEYGWTVPRLFALIETERRQRPGTLRVQFDPDSGIPRQVLSGSLAADDGIHLTVTRYEPLAAPR